MPTTYLQDVKQRFTEFGGFTPIDAAVLPESVVTWADSVLERAETGLTTLVVPMAVGPEGAMKAVRDDLTVMADRMAKQERTEVQVVLLIATAEPLTRQQYERWQEFRVNKGGVRLVPWAVDLARNQLFAHQGPPFGIDPDIETLAAPEPAGEPEPEPTQPAQQRRRTDPEALPRPWVTIGLLVVIVSIWVAMTIIGQSLSATEETRTLMRWGAAGRPDMWLDSEYWRMFTAAFLHIGLIHLAMNGYSLWMVGKVVEWLYGSGRMLFIYLAAAVAGSLASAVLGPPVVLSAGASGAIFGLLGAVIWYRISSPLGDRIRMRSLLMTLVLNLGLTISMYKIIDSWNHLGGLVGGFVAAAAVGVPAVDGLPAPRLRPDRMGRIISTAAVTMLLGAVTAGLIIPPGPGRDLAQSIKAYNDGRYEEAAAGFERAARRQSDEPWLREVLIMSYVQLGKCGQAQNQLIQAQALDAEYTQEQGLEKMVRQCGQ